MPWCANMAASYFFVCTFGTVIKNMISVIGGLTTGMERMAEIARVLGREGILSGPRRKV